MTVHTFVDQRNKHFEINSSHYVSLTKNNKLRNDDNGNNSLLSLKWVYPFGRPNLKPTARIRRWIEDQVRNYARQIGITEEEIPHIVLTREEVHAMPIDDDTACVRNETSKYLGIYFKQTNTIFINVRKFASLKDLNGAIVHELVHYRFPHLRHEEKYEKRVSLILKGKQYRPLHVQDTLTKNDAANGNNSNGADT